MTIDLKELPADPVDLAKIVCNWGVYVAGNDHNAELLFFEIARILDTAGAAFVRVQEHAREGDEGMRRNIEALIDCDIVVLLPGWKGSAAVTIALTVAEAIGLEVYEIVYTKDPDPDPERRSNPTIINIINAEAPDPAETAKKIRQMIDKAPPVAYQRTKDDLTERIDPAGPILDAFNNNGADIITAGGKPQDWHEYTIAGMCYGANKLTVFDTWNNDGERDTRHQNYDVDRSGVLGVYTDPAIPLLLAIRVTIDDDGNVETHEQTPGRVALSMGATAGQRHRREWEIGDIKIEQLANSAVVIDTPKRLHFRFVETEEEYRYTIRADLAGIKVVENPDSYPKTVATFETYTPGGAIIADVDNGANSGPIFRFEWVAYDLKDPDYEQLYAPGTITRNAPRMLAEFDPIEETTRKTAEWHGIELTHDAEKIEITSPHPIKFRTAR